MRTKKSLINRSFAAGRDSALDRLRVLVRVLAYNDKHPSEAAGDFAIQRLVRAIDAAIVEYQNSTIRRAQELSALELWHELTSLYSEFLKRKLSRADQLKVLKRFRGRVYPAFGRIDNVEIFTAKFPFVNSRDNIRGVKDLAAEKVFSLYGVSRPQLYKLQREYKKVSSRKVREFIDHWTYESMLKFIHKNILGPKDSDTFKG